VSGKRYRLDQQQRSAVSGKSGRRDEFVLCRETREPMLKDEFEQCEST
jgi:hypothetical protein